MNSIQQIDLKAQKPKTHEQFGYFLAGLIDADGYIDKEGNVSIFFHQRDLSVAYYIKHIVGYGSVLKRSRSKSYTYKCCRKDKVKIIGDMIRHKLRSPIRIEQFNLRLVPKIGGEHTQKNIDEVSLQNHWLAGFIQGDGSFQIQVNHRPSGKKQVMVVIQISQKNDIILQQIKNSFGGVIYYYKPQNYYFYTSSSIPNALKYVHYLDVYQVIGSSLRIYKLWRQAYFYVQKKKHLTELDPILSIKACMSKLKS